jgi:hypothetical protein
MVLKGQKGRNTRGEARREKNGVAERPGERGGRERDAGWQADACPVYWFIRRP